MKQTKRDGTTMTIYQGPPRELLTQISQQIVQILLSNGIEPTGLHVLGLFQAACTAVQANRKAEEEGADPASTRLGQMPSFNLALRFLTHAYSGREWTAEDLRAIDDEIGTIAISMGGQKLPPGTGEDAFPYLAPRTDLIH